MVAARILEGRNIATPERWTIVPAPSILIRRDLFLDLGGFDEHYLPAYGEDSDLALKIRSRGQSVIYQPLSAVIHHEGATSGTDTSTGAKAHQVENARKLTLRWKDLLCRRISRPVRRSIGQRTENIDSAF